MRVHPISRVIVHPPACTHTHTHRGAKDYTRPVNFVLSEKRLNDNEEEEEGDVDSDLDDEVSSYQVLVLPSCFAQNLLKESKKLVIVLTPFPLSPFLSPLSSLPFPL